MLSALVKYTAPLLLILILVTITGTASAFVSTPEITPTDSCCSNPEPPQQQQTTDDCVDPGCRCTSCGDVTTTVLLLSSAGAVDAGSCSSTQASTIPTVYPVPIDYPPELS